MSAEPVPIRRDVTPVFDAEREIVDFCALKVREFASAYGSPATRVVLVLVGKTGANEQASLASQWDTESARTASELRGHAMALLAKEAAA